MSQQWKVLLAFTGIFVAGAVAGGVVALRVEKERATAAAKTATDKAAANISPQLMKQLTSTLKLTPAQKEKIQPVIDQAAEKIAALTQDYREATMSLREEMEDDVSGLLTPEQIKILGENRTKRRTQVISPSNLGNRGGRRGGPGGIDFRGGNTTSQSSSFGPGRNRQGGDPNGRRGGGAPGSQQQGGQTTATPAATSSGAP